MAQLTFGPVVIAYDGSVLAPRPWTQMQSDWAIELLDGLRPGPVLELCCGAGHIGLAVAARSDRALVQVDASAAAVELARRNASANGLGDRVEVRHADVAEGARPGERFPLVLADPPYLPAEEVGRWPDDPVLAIDGGDDGLAVHRRCLAAAARALSPGGAVLLQALGERQVEQLRGDAAGCGLEVVDVRSHDEDRAVAHLRAVAGRAPGG